VRDKRGRVTVLDIPGAKGTEAVKLNDRGQAVGEYSQDTPIVNDSANPRDYLWDRGRVTTIEIPGADPVRTEPLGLNNRGQVVGPYLDRNGALHGFLWDEGRITTIDVPGATGTSPTAVNDRGQLLGVYTDAAGAFHGFVLSRGRYVSFDAPDQGDFPLPLDINNRGQIVGYTVDDPVTMAARAGSCWPRGRGGPPRRSASRVRLGPSRPASTTRGRSSASTRTPTPRRAGNPPAGNPSQGSAER
jgi:probable HAF family extracellular repeat protein